MRKSPHSFRRLKFESLEERELLSVTQDDYAVIRETYPDLHLSANLTDYNVIEVAAGNLSEESLRGAIETAEDTAKSDLIVVRTSKDAHKITLKKESLKFDGDSAKKGSLTIVSLGDTTLTVDANKKDRAFFFKKGNIALGGIEIINGNSYYSGGGLYLANGQLSLTKCTFKSNKTTLTGGGFYVTGDLTITEVISTGNTAEYEVGGGYCSGTLVMRGCDFFSNNGGGFGGDGGSITWENVIRSTIADSRFNNNYTLNETGGGGIVYGNGSLKISDCVAQGNNVNGKGSSAISVSGDLILENSLITENASSNGGGIFCGNSFISNCVITKNKGILGGGIKSVGAITIIGSTIAFNEALREGGAVYHQTGGLDFSAVLDLTIINSTITKNTAQMGAGGINIAGSSGSFNIINSDFIHNVSLTSSVVGFTFSGLLKVSFVNSIFLNGDEDAQSDKYLPYAKNSLIGARQAALLGTSVTLPNKHIYYPRLPGCWAINGGTDELIQYDFLEGYDIAGNPRVFGKNIDIGAVEYVPKPAIKSNVTSLQRGCTTTLTAELTDSQFDDCSFVWDLDGDCVFGQSALEIGQSVLFDSFPYSPEVNGKRVVKVLLQDEQGHRSNPIEYGITMEKVMPCYGLLMPEDIIAKQTAWFEFNASDPGGLAVMDWLVSWGDGSEETYIPGGPRNRVELNHRYAAKGDYSIGITTTNILGEKSSVTVPVSAHDAVVANEAVDIVMKELGESDADFNAVAQSVPYDENDLNIIRDNGLESYTTWTEIGGIYRATKIDASGKNLSGILLLSGLSSLEELICSYNKITSIDASGCSSLSTLKIDNNPLKNLALNGCASLSSLKIQCDTLVGLIVSGCTKLETLECRNKPLDKLDVTGCVSLKSLNIGADDTQIHFTLTGINDCRSLIYLDCSNRFFSEPQVLDLTDFKSLETLITDNCGLTSLVTNRCDSLKYVSCSGNRLTKLNVLDCFKLTYLDCSDNSLGTLSLYSLKELRSLKCSGNYLKTLNINETPLLETLDCGGNQITALQVKSCKELVSLRCDNNKLETLVFFEKNPSSNPDQIEEVTGCLKLTEIHCQHNRLQSLDLSELAKLEYLDCGNNQMEEIKIAGLSELTVLLCFYNQLSTLDISGVLKLTMLSCGYNKLTAIYCDVMDMFPALKKFNCSGNLFQSLSLPRFPSLTELGCNENPLETLDVSHNSDLVTLGCSEGKLTTLDVSNLKNLVNFYCDNNNLSKLDLSSQSSLSQLDCSYNKLTSLILTQQKRLEYLKCHGNMLRFSTLPPTNQVSDASESRYVYETQRPVPLSETGKVDERIDLSSEYSIAEFETTYRWFYNTGEPLSETEVLDLGGGCFAISPLKSLPFYCEMKNTAFPRLTLQTERVTTNPPQVPKEPTDFVCYYQIGHTLFFSWTATDGATGYVLQFKKSNDANWITASPPVGTTARIPNLPDDTVYNFRVKAVNRSGESGWATLDVLTQKMTPASPTISAAGSSVQRGCSIMLSGQTSVTDVSGLKWLWDFDNDGIFGEVGPGAFAGNETGQTAWLDTEYYIPEIGGKRTVKLIIEDAEGNRSEPTEYRIAIDAPAPTFSIDFSDQLIAKRSSYFEISAVPASNLGIMDWLISWSDESEDTHILGGPRNRVELVHRYMAKGEYSIEVTTTNILGEISSVSLPIQVHEAVNENNPMSVAMEEFIEIKAEANTFISTTLEPEGSTAFEQYSPDTTVAQETYWRRVNQGISKSEGILHNFLIAHWSEGDGRLFSWS